MVYLAELTVCFDENFADASVRKQTRYYSLKVDLQAKGWRCYLWPVPVGGGRGIVDETSFNPLHAFCKASVWVVANQYERLAKTCLAESHNIWYSRNGSNSYVTSRSRLSDYQFIFIVIDIVHATLMSHDVSMCVLFF